MNLQLLSDRAECPKAAQPQSLLWLIELKAGDTGVSDSYSEFATTKNTGHVNPLDLV